MDQREIGVTIVTGGASGLGAAVAAAVEQSGGKAIVFDRQAPVDGHDFDHRIVDLADGRAAEQAVHEVAATEGRLDGVVTAAGTDACGKIEQIDGDAWDTVVKVNLLGTAAVARAAVPYLEQSRGSIVTVGSTLGQKAVSDATAYCASKFGVLGFTRALAIETAGRVGVTLLTPGGMSTHFFDSRDEQYKPPADAKLNRPEDVASAVIFALRQPPGCEVREITVCPSTESSWPP